MADNNKEEGECVFANWDTNETCSYLVFFLSPQSMLRGLVSGRRCLRRLCDKGEATEVVQSSGGYADMQVRWREFAKGNVAASKTTTSDRRARGGGVIDTLTESN